MMTRTVTKITRDYDEHGNVISETYEAETLPLVAQVRSQLHDVPETRDREED
jgi:hypothetical protein